ncbi:Rmf/CrpP fold protein [Streptosporangium nondiastaticum]|uniref:Rmf/CrpP fold protein n=1 Tax=Streptosporangium nondiastaticum TaxID=35764 RepID=UPI00167B2344|nr:Rmf/CrpP fold protein [Streptosporangium nondiastaticum]
MGARVDIVQAMQDGRRAGAAGDRPTACPYPAGNLLRSAWLRGYAAARPLLNEANPQ